MLSAMMLLGGPDRSPPVASPLRLAIYYGYPSLANGAHGDLARAVAVFSEYDVIVLGDGLEMNGPLDSRGLPRRSPERNRPGRRRALARDSSQAARSAGREEHAFTTRLIEQLRHAPRHPEVYGYVDLGRTQQLPLPEIAERLGLWARMGVAGVLLDEAGFDFGVTRERQNAAITAAHAHGLRVCVNAFRLEDVFGATPTPLNDVGGGNPTGLAPVISAQDAVLLESFAVRNGVPEGVEGLTARTLAALDGRARFGTRVFAVTTSVDAAHDVALAQYGWWTAAAFGVDAYGWGMPSFSAISSALPFVPRPDAERALARAEYVDELIVEAHGWRRATTVGSIVVDAAARRAALEPR